MLQANLPKPLEKSECLCYTVLCIFILTRRLTANDGSGTIADSTAQHSTAQHSTSPHTVNLQAEIVPLSFCHTLRKKPLGAFCLFSGEIAPFSVLRRQFGEAVIE